jgi:hypothetical protein
MKFGEFERVGDGDRRVIFQGTVRCSLEEIEKATKIVARTVFGPVIEKRTSRI